MDCWQILQIEPTGDTRAIKRAYAKLLKTTRPDDDAAAYQALREAFDEALAIAPYLLADEDEDDWSFDGDSDSETPPPDPFAADYADNRKQQPETPDSGFQAAFAPVAETPPDPAGYSEQDFSGCSEAGLENEAEAQRQPESVQSAFADPDTGEDSGQILDELDRALEDYYGNGGKAGVRSLLEHWPQLALIISRLPLGSGGEEAAAERLISFSRRYAIRSSALLTQWADYFGWDYAYRPRGLSDWDLDGIAHYRRRYPKPLQPFDGEAAFAAPTVRKQADPDEPYRALFVRLKAWYDGGGAPALIWRTRAIFRLFDTFSDGALEPLARRSMDFLQQHGMRDKVIWAQWADYFARRFPFADPSAFVRWLDTPVPEQSSNAEQSSSAGRIISHIRDTFGDAGGRGLLKLWPPIARRIAALEEYERDKVVRYLATWLQQPTGLPKKLQQRWQQDYGLAAYQQRQPENTVQTWQTASAHYRGADAEQAHAADMLIAVLVHAANDGSAEILAYSESIRQMLDRIAPEQLDRMSDNIAAFLRYHKLDSPQLWLFFADYFNWFEPFYRYLLDEEERRTLEHWHQLAQSGFAAEKLLPPQYWVSVSVTAADLIRRICNTYWRHGSGGLLKQWPQFAAEIDDLDAEDYGILTSFLSAWPHQERLSPALAQCWNGHYGTALHGHSEQQPEPPDSGFQAAFAPVAETPPNQAEHSEQDFSSCPAADSENETEARAARQPESVQSAFADPEIEEEFWDIWDNIEQMLTHCHHTGGSDALARAWPQIRDALDSLPLGGSAEASQLCAAFLRHYRIEHPAVWTQWADYFGWGEDVRGATLTPEELQQLVLHRRSMARLERRRHNRYGGKTAQENGKRQPEDTGFGDSYDPDPPPADDTPLLVSQLEYLYAEGGSALLLERWPQISGALDNLPLGAAEHASHAFAGFLRRHRIAHPLLWVQWADYFRWGEDVRGEVLSLAESQRLAQFRRNAALLAGYRHVRPDAGSAPDIGEGWRLTRAFNRFLGSHPSGWRNFQAACAAALLWPELDRETDESDRADIAVSHPPLARLLLCNRPWRIAMLLAVLALCLAAGMWLQPVSGESQSWAQLMFGLILSPLAASAAICVYLFGCGLLHNMLFLEDVLNKWRETKYRPHIAPLFLFALPALVVALFAYTPEDAWAQWLLIFSFGTAWFYYYFYLVPNNRGGWWGWGWLAACLAVTPATLWLLSRDLPAGWRLPESVSMLLVLLWFDAALWLLMSHNERFERINALILRAARFQAAPLWLRPFAAVAAGVAWLLLLPAYAARAVLLNAHGRMLGCTALALTLLMPLLPLLPSGHPHTMLLAYPALLLVAWLRLLLGDWVLRFIECRPAPENAKAA